MIVVLFLPAHDTSVGSFVIFVGAKFARPFLLTGITFPEGVFTNCAV
jgi:hypothetical protein